MGERVEPARYLGMEVTAGIVIDRTRDGQYVVKWDEGSYSKEWWEELRSCNRERIQVSIF